MNRLPSGVIFDCDGTLVDTESLSDRAWTASLAERGIVPKEADFRALVGYPFAHNWAYFSRIADLGDRDTFRLALRDRYLALFESDLEVHADAVGTLRELAALGVPIGVASSSARASVERVLARAGVRELVGVIVGLDDVRQPKPAPEPYARAVAALGLEAGSCSAVEDSAVGVRSARAAGLFTVAVVRAHADALILAEADLVVDEVTLACLTRQGSTADLAED